MAISAFDADVTRRMPGPIVVAGIRPAKPVTRPPASAWTQTKPYYIGIDAVQGLKPCPNSMGRERPETLCRTPLNETHRKMGAKMVPFAGWEMPVWYTSVVEEHLATRQAAGLFDVSHMGVYQAEGPNAVLPSWTAFAATISLRWRWANPATPNSSIPMPM